ncbi:MAG: T9SS type A sorting domain-containing protein, partial [Lentimicrobium sp.]|nr:T9SS type A sorting domain-containing protein [Lentimicrobium sp.]
GQALAVVASGFLDPSANSNGPSFGLYAVLPSGGTFLPLGLTTGVEENVINTSSFSTYPNPVSDKLNVEFTLETASDVNYSVYNASGMMVKSGKPALMANSNQLLTINVSDLPSGLYVVRVTAGNTQISSKVQVVN